MTIDFGKRRLCIWFCGIHHWRDVFAWAWHGRKINPTWNLMLCGVNVQLCRNRRSNYGQSVHTEPKP